MSALKWQFEDNPVLQHLLTSVLFLHVGFIVYMLYKEEVHNDQQLSPLSQLGVALVLCSGFVYIVNFVSKAAAECLKRRLVKAKLVTSMPVHSPALLKKWQDRSWQLIVHVSMTAFEVYILNTDLSGMWSDMDLAYKPLPWHYNTPFNIRLLYIVQFAIWICTAVNHRFLADPGYDYFMMFTHHIATLFLIAGSYYLHYTRIGVAVMLVHDASDIGVDAQKLVQYMKLRARRGFFLSESFFIANMLSYFYLLLYVYPFRIIRAAFVGPVFLNLPGFEQNMDAYPTPLSRFIRSWHYFFSDSFMEYTWGPCNVVLFTLFTFHIIWSKMFLKRLVRITKENLSDTFVKEYERRESGSLDLYHIDEATGEHTEKREPAAVNGKKHD